MDRDSAIFLSALQNKTQNDSKHNEMGSRVQCLICRIWDLAGIWASAKVGSVEIVLFERDRLKH